MSEELRDVVGASEELQGGEEADAGTDAQAGASEVPEPDGEELSPWYPDLAAPGDQEEPPPEVPEVESDGPDATVDGDTDEARPSTGNRGNRTKSGEIGGHA